MYRHLHFQSPAEAYKLALIAQLRTYRVNHVGYPPGTRPLRNGHRTCLLVLLEHLVVVVCIALEQKVAGVVLLRILCLTSAHLVRTDCGYLLLAVSLGSVVQFRVVARSTRIHPRCFQSLSMFITATNQSAG